MVTRSSLKRALELKYSAYAIYFDPITVGIQNKYSYLEVQARTVARGICPPPSHFKI